MPEFSGLGPVGTPLNKLQILCILKVMELPKVQNKPPESCLSTRKIWPDPLFQIYIYAHGLQSTPGPTGVRKAA